MSWSRVSLVCSLLCAAQAVAQTTSLEGVLNDLDRVHRISGISISPDGRWVAWNQEVPGSTGNELYLYDTRSQAAAMGISVPGGGASGHSERVAWSPDSQSFAVLSRPGRGEQFQIYATSVSAPSLRKISDLHGYADDLKWSPDGKQLSFLYAENGGGGGPLTARAAQVGEIGEQLHNQRIALMPAEGGEVQQATPADLNIYEYDWSRDGSQFAAIAAPGPADNNWWVAKLYTASVSGGDMHVIYTPPRERQIAIPRWSPDRKQVAFIGGLMSDQGFVGGDVFVISASGGVARDITPGARFSASSLEWEGDSELLITADQEGGGAMYRIPAAGGSAKPVWHGEDGLHEDGNFPDLALSADRKQSAMVWSTWQDPPEVWLGAPGEWKQLTHINAEQHPHWGKAESVRWANGAYHMQGWLLYPEHYDPAKHYPMVVSVHGGPSSEHSPSWPNTHFDMSVLSAFGYLVFFPNPRGSYGEGEAFTRANVKDFGGGDLKDLLAGIDAVIQKVPVDPQRLGVTGWSYGGYMTMWTVTQTHRFKAAVAGAGIADWLSYYGENSIDEWMIPFFGASVYDNPAVYAKSAPIDYIKNVKTPTLVLVGEADAECPAPQSFEFWHALKALGVPTQLVVYPGEGHAFDKPEDNLDRMRRSIEWFDKYLAGS